ncbi:MAG: glycerate kinase [Oculatellaceae cyanobacterium Prado106]|jgi:D-glycerate 3-kinase|nr:glycerate kinase [Oculatellaceae cyanobacterium Prado106]
MTSLHDRIQEFCAARWGWETLPAGLFEEVWLPLATQIAAWRQETAGVLIQGILGGQGTGKTTLATILIEILREWGLTVGQLSLDDLYKTYADRQQLQRADPRFRWRGPPGTHDVALGLAVLRQLKQGVFPIELPRFDKSAWNGMGDRTHPEVIAHADILLFEGWFVGVRPIDPGQFEQAPAPIERESDRIFAREMNDRLQDYLPLWENLDRLIVLHPQDYRWSKPWRREAEQRMMAAGRSGMTDEEIDEFVEYFWRSLHPELLIQPLLSDPDHVDLVIEIDTHHQPQRVYQPTQKIN